MEPDRLEAWFAADCDAEAGAVIAEQIVQQAKGFWQDDQQTVGSTAALGNAGGKHMGKQVVGTKRRVPSVFDLLVKQPPRGADIEVASITAVSGSATSGDAHVRDDQPAGLINSLMSGGIEPRAGGGWQEKLPAHQVVSPPAELKRPPAIATSVSDEAEAPKEEQVPKDPVKGANESDDIGTMVRVLRAKLFGEMLKDDCETPIADSEFAKELENLIGHDDAEAIRCEVLTSKSYRAVMRKKIAQAERKVKSGEKVKPNRGR
jgi:hypothetical protein